MGWVMCAPAPQARNPVSWRWLQQGAPGRGADTHLNSHVSQRIVPSTVHMYCTPTTGVAHTPQVDACLICVRGWNSGPGGAATAIRMSGWSSGCAPAVLLRTNGGGAVGERATHRTAVHARTHARIMYSTADVALACVLLGCTHTRATHLHRSHRSKSGQNMHLGQQHAAGQLWRGLPGSGSRPTPTCLHPQAN